MEIPLKLVLVIIITQTRTKSPLEIVYSELWPSMSACLLPRLSSRICPHLPQQSCMPRETGYRCNAWSHTSVEVPSQTKMLPGVSELVTRHWAHHSYPHLGSLSCRLLEGEGEKKPSKPIPTSAGMCTGTDWGKNKSFEQNMQQCVQICLMAELEFFLIVNMSRSFVPPTQKCVLLGVRFYSWPA